jgi:5-(carboxyamino)imidazole ribonucleotide mutase
MYMKLKNDSKDILVSIVMGSDSDLQIMSEAAKIMEQFSIPHELFLTSAHRSPARTMSFAQGAADRGIQIMIVGAGAAAHLAGVIASHTLLPVIGVPIDATSLKGLDALLSTVQMPGGIPVATMAIGKAGARNAALLAIRILALTDKRLQDQLADYVRAMADEVERKQGKLIVS